MGRDPLVETRTAQLVHKTLGLVAARLHGCIERCGGHQTRTLALSACALISRPTIGGGGGVDVNTTAAE